jgi:hypothetical protein
VAQGEGSDFKHECHKKKKGKEKIKCWGGGNQDSTGTALWGSWNVLENCTLMGAQLYKFTKEH